MLVIPRGVGVSLGAMKEEALIDICYESKTTILQECCFKACEPASNAPLSSLLPSRFSILHLQLVHHATREIMMLFTVTLSILPFPSRSLVLHSC